MEDNLGLGLRAVEEQRQVDILWDLYSSLFQARFNEKPVMGEEDSSHLRWLAQNFSKNAQQILRTYLAYNDEWVAKKAYPLYYLKKNINEILASGSKMGKIDRPVYVVSVTTQMDPVCSYNAREMGPDYWFKPVLLGDWLKFPRSKPKN